MQQDISRAQIDLLEKAKTFLCRKGMRSPRQSVTDPENYLSVWASESLGNLRIQCLRQGRWMSKDLIVAYLRSIIRLGYEADVFLDYVDAQFAYDRVVVSWCVQSDFLQDGSVQSRYFNCTTEDFENVLWVMLPLDECIPEHKKKNIIFLSRKILKSFSLLYFLRNTFFCLSRGISLSVDGLFSQKFADEVVAKTDISSVRFLLMPYEGQPWQHTLCLNVKNSNKNIYILGDLHSCLPPLPTDFIKRSGAPDIFFLHGAGQKDIAIDSLDWAEKDIKVVPSLRFGKDHSPDLRNKILLPYNFRNPEFILDQLDFFFKNFGKEIPNLDVRGHPAQSTSLSHLNLIKGLQALQSKYNHKNETASSPQDVVLVIGASSAIIECLERGMKVFQITEDTVLESYGPATWKGLKVIYLSDNIVEYSLQGKPDYLEFGTSDIRMMFDNA